MVTDACAVGDPDWEWQDKDPFQISYLTTKCKWLLVTGLFVWDPDCDASYISNETIYWFVSTLWQLMLVAPLLIALINKVHRFRLVLLLLMVSVALGAVATWCCMTFEKKLQWGPSEHGDQGWYWDATPVVKVFTFVAGWGVPFRSLSLCSFTPFLSLAVLLLSLALLLLSLALLLLSLALLLLSLALLLLSLALLLLSLAVLLLSLALLLLSLALLLLSLALLLLSLALLLLSACVAGLISPVH